MEMNFLLMVVAALVGLGTFPIASLGNCAGMPCLCEPSATDHPSAESV